jgi:hypothetical protein
MKVAAYKFPVIWGFAAICVWLLRRNANLSLRDLWGAYPGRKQIMAVMARFALMAALLMLYVLFFEPERLFAFPRRSPVFWILFVSLYPIVSVIPQGITY